MSDHAKVTREHLRRRAFVYVRQSTTAQVEFNRESTARQYRLAEKAVELGWRREQIKVLDEDLGLSGSGLTERSGFAHLTAEVALGHAGIVLGLEVSRLARNNADWYRLLDLCGATDTLIGDADGIYHPGLFNDRLVLGLKGTMSEAELHVLRARLNGGIRNKAAHSRYEAQRAERRYRAVDPDNRLVARGLEAEWEKCLQELQSAEAELARREQQCARALRPEERALILSLGKDLRRVWSAATTNDRDRKELVRTLLEEVIIAVKREESMAHLTLRWRGGLLSELDVPLPRSHPAPIRTDEETVALVRRLAAHYSDALIAGVLNRQGRRTATGLRFTANHVGSLRTHWGIPCFQRPAQPPEGELVTVDRAAEILGVAPSTMHRWLNDGFIAGEQLTPGAPWKIRMTDDLRSRFVEKAPAGYLPMIEATRLLGLSRQTILQRVKRGELKAVHVRLGRRKGLRIRVPDTLPGLFDQQPTDGG